MKKYTEKQKKRHRQQKHLDSLAAYIIRELKKEGITIQRYDSYSSMSIYLKLDFGVLNSIRISDHDGKKHLAYRYNLLTHLSKFQWQRTEQGWPRYFFPNNQVNEMLAKIKQDRMVKMAVLGPEDYEQKMDEYYRRGQVTPGFWQQAVIV